MLPMFEYTKYDGSPLDRTPRGVKVRLADVYRKNGQRMSNAAAADPGIMQEMAKLTDADLADFRVWFERNGYPTPVGNVANA